IAIDTLNRPAFANPPEVRAEGGRAATTLEVRYTDPAAVRIAGCPVTLRTYNGRLVGPTLRARPGDVLAPLVANRLPRESAAEVEHQFHQQNTQARLDVRPHSYNTTNLHTHGLHVSPSG